MNQKAQNDYEKSLRINPKSAKIYNEMSFFHYKLNYFQLAIQESTYGVSLIDNTEEIKVHLLFTRAESYRLLGDDMKALVDYETLLKNNPSQAVEGLTLISMAKSLVKLKRSEDAISTLEECIKKYPKLSIAIINLAYMYSEKGNYQKAISLNNKALELALGNKEDENIVLSEKIIAEKGSNSIVIALIYNNRGLAKYNLGKLKESLIDINKFLELYPKNSYAYKNRALANIALSKIGLACDDIKKAIQLNFIKQYGNEILELQKKYCN